MAKKNLSISIKSLQPVNRCCNGLHSVDAVRIATKTIAGLYHGATTVELDELFIQTAASSTAEEPEYSFGGSSSLILSMKKYVFRKIHSFSDSVQRGFDVEYMRDCFVCTRK